MDAGGIAHIIFALAILIRIHIAAGAGGGITVQAGRTYYSGGLHYIFQRDGTSTGMNISYDNDADCTGHTYKDEGHYGHAILTRLYVPPET